MASSLTNLTLVRALSGVSTTEIDNTDGQSIIDQAEAEIFKHFDTRFLPYSELEIFDGDETRRYICRKKPVLRVKSLKINGTTVTPSNVQVRKESGVLYLKVNAEKTFFDFSDYNTNVVVYDYGLVEIDTAVVPVTTSNAETAGTSVVIEVSSTTGLSANDYVRIAGTDGYEEVAKISSVSAGVSITVDSLSLPHVAGSTVWRVQLPPIIQKYATVVAALGFIANVVGSSFDAITGYEIEGLRVQKGEPYTQWRETFNQLIAERDKLETMIRKSPTVG